jgi:tRNA(Ile)-lysidine synthetase-like protein
LNDDLDVLERIESHIRRHDLIEPGGEVLCLVSGGADSTCLYHALAELGYRVSALHVDHGLRGAESDADAAWCAERLGAEVVQAAARCSNEAELRDVRYSFRAGELRATGHTLSDQVETILFRLASRGTTRGIEVRREDGVVRPLLCVWREETEAFCRERGLEWRTDSSNDDTLRGLIRNEILPLLERIHPAARENVLRVLDERRTLPPALAELLDAPVGSKRVDLGGGVQAVLVDQDLADAALELSLRHETRSPPPPERSRARRRPRRRARRAASRHGRSAGSWRRRTRPAPSSCARRAGRRDAIPVP